MPINRLSDSSSSQPDMRFGGGEVFGEKMRLADYEIMRSASSQAAASCDSEKLESNSPCFRGNTWSQAKRIWESDRLGLGWCRGLGVDMHRLVIGGVELGIGQTRIPMVLLGDCLLRVLSAGNLFACGEELGVRHGITKLGFRSIELILKRLSFDKHITEI